ncbi:MAG TPA: HD-GYP domain-containing protein [Nitrospiria bacterium]|jgi:HD-GYP domain-containing protein (c-di-GMP phosphodiesterase class II)|nr:HD-GYP domain-containing protein [Nitrospiria bacterium]
MVHNPNQQEGPRSNRQLLSSRGFDEEMAKKGKELVNQFYILMKTAQIHEPTNVAMEAPIENILRTLRGIWQWRDDAYLRLEGDYLFLDELKLKMDIDGFTSFTSLIDALKQLQIGGILFKKGSTVDELKRFVYVLVQTDPNIEASYEGVTQRIKTMGIVNVEVDPFEEKKDSFDDILQDSKEMAKSTYFRTMTAVAEVMDNIKLGQAVSVKRAKRVVQGMVDLLLQEESTLLGLTTLRSHDEYTHHHSVNVCILSLTMGQRLGYAKKELTELGIAALFHDMGKASISPEILNKPTDFTEEEWQIMRRHPILGVKYVIKLKGVNEMTIRMVTGIFEHHLNYDSSGYPKLETKWELSLLGRIISLVDCYDALTSSRVYNRVPYPPDRALKFMLNKSGRAFDPILMKVFVNSIGIFPIGTLVLLDTNELGVVVQTSSTPDRMDRPKVKVIADPTGMEVDGDVIDLAKLNEKTGRYSANILKVIDSTKYKVDVSRYFL